MIVVFGVDEDVFGLFFLGATGSSKFGRADGHHDALTDITL